MFVGSNKVKKKIKSSDEVLFVIPHQQKRIGGWTFGIARLLRNLGNASVTIFRH
jgi:hypothetical protein